MSDSAVQIKIPEELISDLVRAEIVKAVGNKEAFVNAVVMRALGAKSDSYPYKSLIETEFTKMVQEEAKKVFGEWIEENRGLLKKYFLQALNQEKGARLQKMAEDLIAGIGRFNVQVSLREER